MDKLARVLKEEFYSMLMDRDYDEELRESVLEAVDDVLDDTGRLPLVGDVLTIRRTQRAIYRCGNHHDVSELVKVRLDNVVDGVAYGYSLVGGE